MDQVAQPTDCSVEGCSYTHPTGAISTASSKHDLELLESTSLLLRIILSSPDDDTDINTSTSTKPPTSLRNLSLTTAMQSLSTYDVLHELQVLDEYRRRSATNLYQRVRALFFLYAIHRFHLPGRRMLIEKMIKKQNVQSSEREEEEGNNSTATTKTVFCPKGYAALLDRRFEESIDFFLASVPTSPSTIPISPTDESNYHQNKAQDVNNNVAPRRTSLKSNLTFSRQSSSATTISEEEDDMVYSTNSNISVLAGEKLLSSAISELTISNSNISLLLLPSDATSSALAKGYRELAFQTLANQVKSSVKSHPGNEWMFTMVNIKDQPLRFSNEMLTLDETTKTCPILLEKTPVRMDLSHSCWSDIFFLGKSASVLFYDVNSCVPNEVFEI